MNAVLRDCYVIWAHATEDTCMTNRIDYTIHGGDVGKRLTRRRQITCVSERESGDSAIGPRRRGRYVRAQVGTPHNKDTTQLNNPKGHWEKVNNVYDD